MTGYERPLDHERSHFVFWIFVGDIGELEPQSKTPWRSYDHSVLISVDKDQIAEIGNAMSVPLRCFPFLRTEARKRGIKRLFYDRWHVREFNPPREPWIERIWITV